MEGLLLSVASQMASVLTLFFVGDSVTLPVVGGLGVSPDDGYASILDGDEDKRARWFGCAATASVLIDTTPYCSFLTRSIPFNPSIQMNGAPTYFQLEVMPFLADVDIVGVFIGINDAMGYRISPAAYGNALLAMAERSVDAGAGFVMLIGAYLPESSVADPTTNALLDGYRAEQEDLADEHAFIVLGPDLRDVIDSRYFLPVDLLHVNAEGQLAIAAAIGEALPAPCFKKGGLHRWGRRGLVHCLHRYFRPRREPVE